MDRFVSSLTLVPDPWFMGIQEPANEVLDQVFSPEVGQVQAGSSECPVCSVVGFSALCYQVKEQRGKAGGFLWALEFLKLPGDSEIGCFSCCCSLVWFGLVLR